MMVQLAKRNMMSMLYLFLLATQLLISAQSMSDIDSQSQIYVRQSAVINYVDTVKNGDRVVLFLHGNPTSSYIWRNVIPYVRGIARCLAPDLIGMGKSSKVKGSLYTFEDHYKFLSNWIDSMNLPKKINLVLHEFGSELGFHWANLHRDRVASITHMESIIGPFDRFDDFTVGVEYFKLLRTYAGEESILQNNSFFAGFPNFVIRQLSEKELNTYLEPYQEPGESRRPILTTTRGIPIGDDGPEDKVKIARDWFNFLSQSYNIPKLYIDAEPGIFSPLIRSKMRNWPNQRTVKVRGLHFIQEDSPDHIGFAIRQFLTNDVFISNYRN